jgi:hypothetical protein
MSAPRPVRVLPGSPELEAVLRVWRRIYAPPDDDLPARLADGRSIVFAVVDGESVPAFVHFRDRKAILLYGPTGTDETARLLAESADFAAYTFEQLWFAGGEWTLETGDGPLFRAMIEHLRATTLRWALVAHLHTDRPFFEATERFLLSLGFRARPGDYVTYRLELPADPAGAPHGPYSWRFLGGADPPPLEDLVRAYAAVFPDDPPAERLRRDLGHGTWGPLSGAAYAGGGGGPVGVVLAREAERGVLHIDRLGTAAAHRGRGVVAGAFMEYARRCREAGIGALSFQVRATNDPATQLVVRHLGARVVKTERFFVLSGAGSAG